jgi:hypothetical protein
LELQNDFGYKRAEFGATHGQAAEEQDPALAAGWVRNNVSKHRVRHEREFLG